MLSGNEEKIPNANFLSLDKLIHYSQILGVSESASLADLEKRFVHLSRNKEINKETIEAFEALEQNAAEQINRLPLSPPDLVQIKLGFFGNSSSLTMDIEPSPPYLRIQDRPSEVQDRIKSAFEKVNAWRFGWSTHNAKEGDGCYFFCGIDTFYLVRALINDNPEQKDFYILDIGAGQFGFGRDLKKFLLNKRKNFPQDIRVHIISLRGEDAPEPLKKEEGICITYELGGFQIENILQEFKSRGMDLIGKIDLAVSRFAFRHLVDPVGTFIQTYSLLKPRVGLLAMDSFMSLYDGVQNNADNTKYLLALTKAPVLTYPENAERVSGQQFILKRPNHEELQLPIVYNGIKDYGENSVLAANCAINFKSLTPELRMRFDSLLYKKHTTIVSYDGELIGDKDLYDFLASKEIFAYGKRRETEYIYAGPLIREISEPKQGLKK